MEKADKNFLMIIISITVLLIVGLSLWYLSIKGIISLPFWNNTQVQQPEKVTTGSGSSIIGDINDGAGNKIILKNENSSMAEGDVLPTDLDLTNVLPTLPPTAKLIGVMDNKQQTSRNLVVKYTVSREKAEMIEQLKSGIQAKGWKVVNSDKEMVKAAKGIDELSVDISQIDKTQLVLTFVINLRVP